MLNIIERITSVWLKSILILSLPVPLHRPSSVLIPIPAFIFDILSSQEKSIYKNVAYEKKIGNALSTVEIKNTPKSLPQIIAIMHKL